MVLFHWGREIKKMATEKSKPDNGIHPLRTSEVYIAFLDILGFTKLLEDKTFEKKTAAIVRVLQNRAAYDGKHHPGLKYLAISDTIIITAKVGQGYALVRKVGQVQNSLLKSGFAVRGAITFGDTLTYEGEIGRNLFGKAFVRAYLAEKELAIYPRVVVTKPIVGELKREIAASDRDAAMYVLRDVDGVYFVNQFASDAIGLKSQKPENKTAAQKNRTTFANVISASVEVDDAKIAMKWRWLSGQLDRQLAIQVAKA